MKASSCRSNRSIDPTEASTCALLPACLEMAVGMPSLLRAAALLAAVRSTATQPVPSAEHTESCGDCGSSVKVGVDFLGNDVGSKTEQPSREACCEFCRVTNTATAWTYSTGADYPKACWCKTQESTNPGCVPPCPRVSGHILPPCLPWGWTFLVLLLVGSVLYAGIGIAYNAKVLGKDELPNTEFWGELAALVRDGIAYTFSTAATTVQDAARPTPRGDYDAIGGVDEEAGGAAAAGVDVEAEKILSKFRKKSKPAKTGPRTRLVEAAIIGRKKAVKELLREKEAKAELDCGDQRGATAFHHACGACCRALMLLAIVSSPCTAHISLCAVTDCVMGMLCCHLHGGCCPHHMISQRAAIWKCWSCWSLLAARRLSRTTWARQAGP